MKSLIVAAGLLASGSVWAQQNYIVNCDANGLGCAVDQVAELSDSIPGYYATFTLNYRFTCGATLNPYPSKVYAFASGNKASKAWFDYTGSGTVEIQGYGPVKFGDDKPTELASVYMNPKCGLFIDSLTIAPSPLQLSNWGVQRSDFVGNLNSIKSSFAQQPQVLFFAKMHEKNPNSFRSIIQKKIDDLKEKVKTDPLAELDLIQWEAILDTYPEEKINQAFAKVEEFGIDLVARARDFIEIKVNAGLARDTELEDLAVEVEKNF